MQQENLSTSYVRSNKEAKLLARGRMKRDWLTICLLDWLTHNHPGYCMRSYVIFEECLYNCIRLCSTVSPEV